MKLNIKKLAVAAIIALSCACPSLFANGLDNRNAIGMYVIGSETPIGGIQYERRFTDLFSTKFGTYIYYSKADNSDSPVEFNFTVEPDFTLFETSWKDKVCSRLFAYGLAGYDYTLRTTSHWDSATSDIVIDSKRNQHTLIAGAGFGFDFTFFDHLSIPLQFGFMGTLNDTDPNIGFCAGIAVRYAW
ncbi:MAG: hypothetical protein J5726_10245 [Treponema sp.]|nr:hypothetical protein [Treponema sp.]